MKITFVLPGHARAPYGGGKVMYEYANNLAKRGHQITMIHPAYLTKRSSTLRKLKSAVNVVVSGSGLRTWRPDAWFSIDQRVKMLWVPSLHARWVPDSDVVVATAWQTAEWVSEYPKRKGRKLYLIHDFEFYMTTDPATKARMNATYLSGMCNIITSPAGLAMLEECGAPVNAYIPNAINHEVYKLKINPAQRSSFCIGFPSRPEPYKGTEDIIAALRIIQAESKYDLDLWTFGWRRLENVPKWIKYYERPSDEMLSTLYNRSSIFVTPSHFEGWGLPGSEAMACGAALVSTDHVGVRAYAKHEETALLSPPKNPEALADNILRLVRDDDLRIYLATCGHEYIQQFTWERAVNTFEQTLQVNIQQGSMI